MTLNQSKCGVLTVTRNVISVQSSYHLINDDHTSTSLIKKLAVQRDLGVLTLEISNGANKLMLYVQRPTECWDS